jgi:hypothetical protein
MRPDPDPYRLVKYVALGAGEGVVAGWIFLMAVVKLDLMGLGGLLDRSPDGAVAILMLLWFFGITFGMVGIAWRVMVLLPGEKS